MSRPLRLGLILLLFGAGVVVAAPVIMNQRPGPLPSAAVVAPKPIRNEFILWVDSESGCLWRVSVVTGRRELDPLPCRRPKNRVQNPKN
jgi:hypothetical protein